jgi:hypothetical protein
MYYDTGTNTLYWWNGTAWVPATGGAGGSVAYTVSQTGHGFAVGNMLIYNGTAYVLAKADTPDNAEVVGVVSAVADANNFTFSTIGEIPVYTGLTAGATYFLSDTTAGAITLTEPTTVGHISKPVGVALSTTTLIFNNWRGEIVGASSSTISSGPISAGPPTSPHDGDIWIALAAGASGENWQFRYNAGSSSAYKWEFIGGPKLQQEQSTALAIAGSSVWRQDTGLGILTFPREGDYFLGAEGYATASTTGAQTLQFGWWYNGAISGNPLSQIVAAAASYAVPFVFDRRGNVAAGATYTLAVWSNSTGNFTMNFRTIWIIPIRIL